MNVLSKIFLSLLVLFVAQSVSAFEINSARERGLGGAIILSEPTAADILRAPISGFGSDSWKIEAGLSRRFNLSELDVGYLVAVYSSSSFTYGIGIQQFGQTENFAEKTIRAVAAYQRSNFSAGINFSGSSFEFGGGYISLRMVSVGLSAGYRHERFLLSAVIDELNHPTPIEGAPEEPVRGVLFAELLGQGSFTLSGVANFEERLSPSFGVGQSLALSDNARISWGIKSEPLEYGAGIEFAKEMYSLVYTGSFHPELGYSHNASLLINLGG